MKYIEVSRVKDKIQYLHEIDIVEGEDYRDISLRFTDLSWSNLEKEENITAWNLAGSNLTGVKLPDKFQFSFLSQLTEASKMGVVTYTGMLLALFGCWLVRLSVSDIDVVREGLNTKLPIIGTSVDIHFFYLLAPLIINTLHFYFQLILQKVLIAVVNLPIFFPDGSRIDQKLYPWPLLNLSELLHNNLWKVASPYSRLNVSMTIFLFWLIVPVSIIAFWIHYLEAHDLFISLCHCFSLLICIAIDRYFILRSINIVRNSYMYHLGSLASELANRDNNEKRKNQIDRSRRYVKKAINDLNGIRKKVTRKFCFTLIFTGVITLSYTFFITRGRIKIPKNWATVNMSYAKCQECVFTSYWGGGRHLEGALANNAELNGAIFREAILQGADFSEAILDSADFSYANLIGVNLTKASLNGTNMKKAVFQNTRLTGVDFTNTNLDGADFSYAILEDVNLTGTSLNGTIMNRTGLTGVYERITKDSIYYLKREHLLNKGVVFND